MKFPHLMNTMSEAMTKLRDIGFDNDFVMGDKGLFSRTNNKTYQAKDLIIKKVYRFEGNSDPGDSSILYAISASDGTKGIFIDAFGVYSDHDPLTIADFFKKIKIENEHGDHES